MQSELLQETRRQIEICNACRYCEGFCSVYPAIARSLSFSDGNIVQLANLCHDCRGCYYACQYTEPHEFAINMPKALAEVRQVSWQEFVWPGAFARLFNSNCFLTVISLVLAFAILYWLTVVAMPNTGSGFYRYMSHGMMVAIFLPAFIFPILSVSISLGKYWKFIGGGPIRIRNILESCKSTMKLKNLSGGHGYGCNFENEDEFSNLRRYFHQATVLGFLLCFASTGAGTIMHFMLGLEAPYSFWSVPKLLGVPGGIILCVGTFGLAWLKSKADSNLSPLGIWNGEMAFVILLFFVSATGLALYACTGTKLVSVLLPIHLGLVLSFFLITPYTKMVHGFYRMAALIYDATTHENDRTEKVP